MPRRSHGYTLMECLMASVILAVAVAAVAQSLTAGQMETKTAQERIRSMALGSAMMEEILAYPGPSPTGSNRSAFTIPLDYHNYTEAAGTLRDAAGELYPIEYQKFSRKVSVVPGTFTVSGFASSVSGVTVTVTVTDPHGGNWIITHFIPNP